MAKIQAADWVCQLELNQHRQVQAGSPQSLVQTIASGADLRIYMEFFHEEHIAPFGSPATRDPSLHGLIREVIDFRQTYLIDQRYVADTPARLACRWFMR